jgi:hypothetical protein
LSRFQGAAGDFAFDQMSENTLNSYSKLVNELKNRFGDFDGSRLFAFLISWLILTFSLCSGGVSILSFSWVCPFVPLKAV